MADTDVIAISGMRFRWPDAGAFSLDIPVFNVRQGEKVFLYGPSGSGKSTLLALLGGVLTAHAGSIRVLQEKLESMDAAARDRFRVDHIGFIFQQFNLLPYLSVLDNVQLPCRFSAQRRARAMARGRSLQEEALHLLAALDIGEGLLGKPVNALSVGQQQRVAAARALIGQPEIIIADEPTSSLDAPRQDSFIDLLLHECQQSNATVLFVSHDKRLATHFDREVSIAAISKSPSTEGEA